MCLRYSPYRRGRFKTAVGSFRIDRAIVGLDMEVQGLCRQGCVELTRLAIETWTVVVEDAIGDIRGLLDLSEEDAPTDGVHTTGREVENIARLDLVVGKDLGDGAILDAPLVFVGRNLLFEARIEVGTRVGLDDIPHLGLAHLAMLALGHLVVGMYLYAQVALGIDELDEQGQLAVVFGVDLRTENGIGGLGHDRDQVVTCKGAIADDAGTGGHSTDLPTLANGLVGRRQALVDTVIWFNSAKVQSFPQITMSHFWTLTMRRSTERSIIPAAKPQGTLGSEESAGNRLR